MKTCESLVIIKPSYQIPTHHLQMGKSYFYGQFVKVAIPHDLPVRKGIITWSRDYPGLLPTNIGWELQEWWRKFITL